MANLNYIDALSAYNKASELISKQLVGTGSEDIEKPSFTGMVESFLNKSINNVKQAEALTAKSVTGDVNTEDLAIAVANAEVSLRTLISIRDRVVSAYQDILRMPI
jgi:flagellar hook-basal body complex protein FliE